MQPSIAGGSWLIDYPALESDQLRSNELKDLDYDPWQFPSGSAARVVVDSKDSITKLRAAIMLSRSGRVRLLHCSISIKTASPLYV